MTRVSDKFPLLTLLTGIVIYLSLQALFVGMPAISGSSEAREAQVIDVISRDGTWILPLRNGVVPSKPPLYHWVGATFSRAFGEVNEFTARFPCQIYASIIILLVALIGFRFATITQTVQSGEHPRRVALLSAGILSLSYGFYQLACQAMVDMTFALCVWCAIASVVLSSPVLWKLKGSLGELNRSLFWFFSSLAILARGPLGVALPICLVAVAGLCVGGFRQTTREFLRPSFGWICLAIPITWYFFAYQVGGEPFLERQIFFENIKRFSGGDFVNSEAWWFYGPSFLRTTFPWGALLLFFLIRAALRSGAITYRRNSLFIKWLPSLVLLAGMALFSSASGKRHSYLLPLIPLVAIQISVELSSIFDQRGLTGRRQFIKVVRHLELGFGVLFLISVGGLALLVDGVFNQHPLIAAAEPAASVVAERLAPILLLAALYVFFNHNRTSTKNLASLWLLAILVMTSVVNLGAAVKAELKGFDAMSALWLALRNNKEELAVIKHPFDEYFDPMLFYVRRPVTLISTEGLVFSCTPNTLYAAKASWLAEQRGDVFRQIETLGLVRERLKAIHSDPSKDVVFFRCKTEWESGAGFNAPPLQDAGVRRPPAMPRATGI